MTFDEWLVEAATSFARETHDQRLGQWLFNHLCEHKESLAAFIRGSSYDPFYVNNKVPEFLQYVKTHWELPEFSG